MRWKRMRRSQNVEDRRGKRRGLVGGGIGGIVIALIAMYFGVDPALINSLLGGSVVGSNPPAREVPADDQSAQFISAVLGDTEQTWQQLFQNMNRQYREPRLVLFENSVQSACGFAQSAMGPFYCPGDQKVYLDLSFFDALASRHDAPGDFAQAYVIAHEVGHHVQTLLGISEKVYAMKQKVSKVEANQLSVRQELQADCFAGVWAYYANRQRQVLEPGDLQEGLAAASAVGDDKLQKQAQGYVVPESFTHGSSAQRVEWFSRGFETGQLSHCDTFGAG